MPVIPIYKIKGETPLQALTRLRRENGEYADAKLSYAGRLDPMAEGVLPILVDEANFEREKYLHLPKIYRTQILFGVQTDTGDILGKIIFHQKSIKPLTSIQLEIEKYLQETIGEVEQKYPRFSSKMFDGSYEQSREDTQQTEKHHTVEIYVSELLKITEISTNDLLTQATNDISKVIGDFRQQEILNIWKNDLSEKNELLIVAEIRLSVSSGFYVRQFAEDLGQRCTVPTLALSIIREQVGEWGITDCVL